MQGRVLIIAGSDSGGGAGIQGDIKTVTALDGYAATAITALTAQNTEGVFAVAGVATDFIARQIELVLSDIGADAVKTGMLHNAEVIDAVCDALESKAGRIPLVVDPVMVAKGGERLLDAEAVGTLKKRLVANAQVITPNLPEAEALTGLAIKDIEAMRRAAETLRALGPKAVLLKGGHLKGEVIADVFLDDDGMELFESRRIDTRDTHGTGCALASAIATGIAQDMPLRQAVVRARAYVREAIRTAPGLGSGHGPLNHAHTVGPIRRANRPRPTKPST